MQSNNNPGRLEWGRVCGLLFAAWLVGWGGCGCAAGQTSTVATTVPLLMPAGLAYDAQGNLYVAERAAHQVLRVSPAGVLTVFAGTGTQGYAGDGGQATAALLDSPAGLAISPAGLVCVADTHNQAIRCVDAGTGVISTVAGTGVAGTSADGTAAVKARLNGPVALAFDGAGNLYFAEGMGHRVRRVDHATGLLTTVAGNGTQGFSGDGGAATAAAIDTPAGIAVDAAGHLFVADAHNQRVRRVDAGTGVISTVAGTGVAGFGGDGGAATGAGLHLPRGVTVDGAGNVYVAEEGSHRVRRVDVAAGTIATVAGEGTEAFAGDGGVAVAASLDGPREVVLSPAGLATMSDTGNGRVRQVDAAGVIHTIAGLGAAAGTTLTLSAPTTMAYGTGAVTATLGASPATGAVTFFDATGGAMETLTTVQLAANAAVMSTAGLPVGVHGISATYAGDGLHAAAESTVLGVTLAPAQAVVAPVGASLVYGQAVPVLTATLTGVLPRDAGSVAMTLACGARTLSGPGTYPITAALTGPAVGNYALVTVPAAVTIAKAPARVMLAESGAGYGVSVVSTTAGAPTGTVTLLDGAVAVGSGTLTAAGMAVFAPGLSLGTHTLTAVYGGDGDFLAATSNALVATVGTAVVADFALATSGASTVTVNSGGAATFGFGVTPVNGALASSIQLAASGLPVGATASFSPAYLPPGGAVNAFTLTVQTAKPAAGMGTVGRVLAGVLVGLAWVRRRRRGWVGLAAVMLVGAMGCAARINPNFTGSGGAASGASSQSYAVTVTGTATGASGAVLVHTATVTLVVE